MLEIERIGRMRKQLGLTQKELASLAGVSQSLIAKIESGKVDPAYSKVTQILVALENRHNQGKKTAEEVMTPQIISVAPTDPLQKAIGLMRSNDLSQLPVLESGKCVGSLSDSLLVNLMESKGTGLKLLRTADVMAESYPVIPASSLVDVAVGLLQHYRAVLVEKGGKLSGIITKADLLRGM
jgi:predicted transcriptional regulator